MSNRNPFSPRSRVIAAVLCLLVAFLGALLVRHFEKKAAFAIAASAKKADPAFAQILAQIPQVNGDTPTDQVIAKARTRVVQSPKSPVAWVTLGDSFMQKARDATDETLYDPAELAYGQALQLAPRNVDAIAGMAWVKGDRHLFDQSIDWGKKALAVDPSNAAAYGILGDAALQLGEYDEAFADYQKMADLRPDISSYSRGAYLLWITGKRQNALWLMQKAIRAGAPFAENTAWCQSRLALMLFNQGAYPSAEQTLAPALEAAPRNMHVLLAAGRIKTAMHDYPAAKDFYRRALEVAPNIEALVSLGDLAAAESENDEAEKYYRQVEELHAAHLAKQAHDHMQMARFYADHDRNLVEALRMAEQQKLTKNVLEADTLAWVYFKNGQFEKAQEAIGRALSRNTPDPAIQYHAGMIAAQTGDRVTAQKYLATALSWSSNFSPLDTPIALQKLDELGSQPIVAAGAAPQP